MGNQVKLVQDDSLRAVEDGYEVQVRLNWYRSLPVSCVETVQLSLDGEPVSPEQISFEINQHRFTLTEMPEQVEEFWFVQDSAVLHVNAPGKVAAGETHTIQAEIALRFPYIMIGPGRFLTTPTSYSTTQTAQQGA
jgi:hypothetical protein